MADFLLMLVVDYTDDRYGFLQIDRNTITEVSMVNQQGELVDYSEEQICTAHWYGKDTVQSAENTVDVVRAFAGELETINGYYVLNMNRIGELNAAVGGVEVTIPEDMTAVDPAFESGATITLDDEQAMRFIRARTQLEDDANALRMSRQRTYLNGFLRKALSLVRSDPDFVNTLWNTMKDTAVTDMSGAAFSRIAEAMRSYEDIGIHALEGTAKIGTVLKDGEEHEEFYPTMESLRDVMTELFSLQHIEEDDEEGVDEEL